MAKPKYDLELFITDFKTVFQANLNAKIAEVNTEKNTETSETNDNFSINTLRTKDWYMNQVPQVWNSNQFIVYGLMDLKTEQAQETSFKMTPTLFIEVIIPDQGEQLIESAIYKLLRYTRCLYEVANENYDEFRHYGKLKMDSLPPAMIEVDGKRLRTAGIAVTASWFI